MYIETIGYYDEALHAWGYPDRPAYRMCPHLEMI